MFVLFAGSWIVKKNDFSKEPGIAEIKNELLDNLFLEDTGLDDFELKKDIHFWYSSTAGKLVQGRHSNGLVDWKNSESVMLGHLLYPDNRKYH